MPAPTAPRIRRVAEPATDFFDPARYAAPLPDGPAAPAVPGIDPRWVANVQAVLDMLPGAVSLSAPVRDADGRLVDLLVLAAGAEAVDIAGRRGRQMVGISTARTYPTMLEGEAWAVVDQVLRTGRAREIGPFTYTEVAEGVAAEAVYTVRVHPLGACLLFNWQRHDEQRRYAARLAQYERLGNLGWAEWDHTGDTAFWSDHLLEIFERDAAAGPATLEEIGGYVHPDDREPVGAALDALLRTGRPMNLEFRIRVPSGLRHLRAMFEATVDSGGRTLRVFGIVQDVTGAVQVRQDRARLADVERQLRDRQRDLRVEHRLVTALQQVILPLPGGPVRRPGLDVAVRFRPAEQLARVGGDWYDVVGLPCGRTLLVIGDVAGHGITAAATMVRLRHALAAFAVTTTDPAGLLSLLNQMVSEDPTEPTATAVVGRYEPDTNTLVWAQAGHPPPVLIGPGGARPLDRPAGVMLGARRDARYTAQQTIVRPDQTVLLYTDGLVERRGPYQGDVLDAVLAEVAPLAAAPVEVLVGALRPGNTGDDTCLLALRPAAA